MMILKLFLCGSDMDFSCPEEILNPIRKNKPAFFGYADAPEELNEILKKESNQFRLEDRK